MDDLVVGANPWLSDVISAGDTWLVRVIVGEAKPGGANSSLVPLDAATGIAVAAPREDEFPEDLYCADGLLAGDVVCVWGDAVYLVDPTTGAASSPPFAIKQGLDFLGVVVTTDGVIVAGVSKEWAPVVVAFGPDG